MSFSAEIRARLGLDTSAFSAGLGRAMPQVEKFGDEVGKTLQRKLGAGDVFRGLLQGLGIGSAQQIADKIVAPFRRAAEDAKALAELSDRVAASNIEAMRARLTAEQQSVLAAQDRVRLENELATLAAKSVPTEEEKRRILELQLEINRALTTEKKLQADADAEAIAASNRALEQAYAERDDFQKWVADRQKQHIESTREAEKKAADEIAAAEQARKLRMDELIARREALIAAAEQEALIEAKIQAIRTAPGASGLDFDIRRDGNKVSVENIRSRLGGIGPGAAFDRGAMLLMGGDRRSSDPMEQAMLDAQLRASMTEQINRQLMEFESRSQAALVRDAMRGQGFSESSALQQQVYDLRNRLADIQGYLFNPNYADNLGLGRLAEQQATASGQLIDYQKRTLEEITTVRRLFEMGGARVRATDETPRNPRG